MAGHMEGGEDVHQRETAESSATSAIGDNSSQEQITGVEKSRAENDFVVLSSESKSSSVPSCDDSEFDRNLISLCDQFSLRLSLSCSNDAVANMEEVPSSAGPDNEVSSIMLSRPLESVEEEIAEEEVMNWGLEMDHFPLAFSESGDSSYECGISERSSVFSSMHSDSQSEDLDRTDIWISSFNLDEEDSKLIQDKEQGFDILSSDFPSPSFRIGRSHRLGPSIPSPAASQRKEHKIIPAEHDSDEPIFWPFEHSSYNSPGFDEFLSISPRKNTTDVGLTGVRQLSPIMLRLHQNKLSAAKNDIHSHRRTMTSTARGIKAAPEKVQKIAAAPSRLSRSKNEPSAHQLSSNCERRRPAPLKIGPRRNCSSPRLSDQPLQQVEAADLRNLVDEMIPIEEFVGLDEFLGHEGINADAWNCDFSLCLSPR